MKMQTTIAMAVALAGCSGGRWVDAPEVCAVPWNAIRQAPAFFIRAPKSDDLRVAVAEMIGTMRKAGVREENLRMLPDSIEQALTLGGRAVCGNVGLSYTGEWECTSKVQRIRCK